MRKLLLSVCCALALLATATVSDAKIFVNISDGTTTLNAKGSATVPFIKSGPAGSARPPLPRRARSMRRPRSRVLICPTRPCTVFFPSGAATQRHRDDTFKIQDIGSAASLQARVEKFDSGASADRVSFKGVKITSIGTLGRR